ncbi:MAG: manganese catalase family protein [Clostridia bacterium]|nr:manganese catalase family protein [Clostridia bacterium]
MWYYEKKLQKPISIKHTNPELAKVIISQYGGKYRNCLSNFINVSKI